MRPDGEDEARLWDMLRHARMVVRLVHGRTEEEFQRNEEFRYAVNHAVLIIGEAARKVSRPFQDGTPHIPWQAIVAQRHILVHEYEKVSFGKIWRLANTHVPALVALLEPLLDEADTPP